jgi:rod shape determining protein RodA
MKNMSDTGDYSRLRRLLDALNIDPVLLTLLVILSTFGIVLLYSGSGSNMDLIVRQLTRLSLGLFLFILVANVPLRILKGLSFWLDLGIIRFQPSEILKLAVPMMVASYLSDRVLPIGLKDLFVSVVLVLIPVMLIARQPDLGTAILVGSAGAFVLFLAGVRWRIILSLMFLLSLMAPLLWKFALHDYQRSRILTMFDPESDPLGSGYHIIQSKIAIGSGGNYGKGWLNGTQSQFDFIPERSTDFIFSVFGEEFGFFGGVILILLYLSIIFRGLYIAARSKDTYGQLVAGAISLTFFVYLFVNIGMVSGMLPVVGVPLPLISYGGTSMVTLLIGFGLIMSIRSTKRFLG